MSKFPYIHYHHMGNGLETILIRLIGDRKILMTIRDDCSPEEHMIIFADPQKLAPVMGAINEFEYKPWLLTKHLQAREGIELARTNAKVINPLPMGVAHMYEDERFRDGITRTSELVHQEADFVPLQVPRRHVYIMQCRFGMDDMPPQPAESYIIRRQTADSWRIKPAVTSKSA